MPNVSSRAVNANATPLRWTSISGRNAPITPSAPTTSRMCFQAFTGAQLVSPRSKSLVFVTHGGHDPRVRLRLRPTAVARGGTGVAAGPRARRRAVRSRLLDRDPVPDLRGP